MTAIERESARCALRNATAADHQQVDDAFSAFDLADRDSYRAFLEAQAYGLLPVEAALDRSGADAIVPDWPDRRRSEALRADIAELTGAEASPAAFPGFSSSAQMLGAIYVLEGSRLGGQLLARAIGPRFPRGFFAAPDPGRWRSLIEILDKTLISDNEISVATGAARSVFARFEAGARLYARTR